MSTTQAKTQLPEFLKAYEACTPAERDEIVTAMLRKTESRRMESIEYYKQMPLALEMLTTSKLMNVVEVVISDAHDWIVEHFPQAKEKLSAYDSLTVFYMSEGEKSEVEMREVIAAICTTWEIDPITGNPITQGKPTAKAKRKPALR